MFKFTINSTDEYRRLREFFEANELEYDDDDDFDSAEGVIKAWKITQGYKSEEDFLIGACMLVIRKGRYVIEGIAVDKVMRKLGLGKIMINKAIDEVKKQGGDSIILMARKPMFYEALGFHRVDPKDAPENLFNCQGCPQYLKECNPEIMEINF